MFEKKTLTTAINKNQGENASDIEQEDDDEDKEDSSSFKSENEFTSKSKDYLNGEIEYFNAENIESCQNSPSVERNMNFNDDEYSPNKSLKKSIKKRNDKENDVENRFRDKTQNLSRIESNGFGEVRNSQDD